MASTDWMPSERTAHVLAQLVAGMPLNGTDPATLDPTWRAVALRIGREGATWDQEIARLGLTDAERFALGKQLAGIDVAHGKTPAAPKPLIRFLRGADIRNLPDMEWLIEGLIPKNCFGTLYGPSGTGKTFLMLHMAAHIALGWNWYGQPVKRGPVLYFAAEGQMGIKQRYTAWCQHYNHGEDVPGLIISPQPFYPTDEELIRALLHAVATFPEGVPSMIVLDTMARCFMGDENSTPDMGAFNRGIDRIRSETGATLQLVHHTGWNTTRMRGNSSLLAALDVEMRVERDELGTIALSCEKMKDGMDFEPWYFTLSPVEGTKSVVALLAKDNKPAAGSVFTLPDQHHAVLTAIAKGDSTGMGFGDVKKASGITRDPTLSSILSDLQHGGFLKAEGDVGTKGRKYAATTKGRMAVTPHFGSTSEVAGSDPDDF